jgi:hypothetical protein
MALKHDAAWVRIIAPCKITINNLTCEIIIFISGRRFYKTLDFMQYTEIKHIHKWSLFWGALIHSILDKFSYGKQAIAISMYCGFLFWKMWVFATNVSIFLFQRFSLSRVAGLLLILNVSVFTFRVFRFGSSIFFRSAYHPKSFYFSFYIINYEVIKFLSYLADWGTSKLRNLYFDELEFCRSTRYATYRKSLSWISRTCIGKA